VATTGIAFENKQCRGDELSRPPSYMSNFFGRLSLNLLKPARLPSETNQYSRLFAFVIIYFLLIDEKVCILKNNKKRIFSINKQPFSHKLFLIFDFCAKEIVKMDKNKSKSSDTKPTIANSLIRNVPFVRPHSVLNSRSRITTNSALSSRSERGARSAMSYNVQRPLTAPASKSKNLGVVDQKPQKEAQKSVIKSARDSQFNNESMTRGVESFEDDNLRKVYLDICRERDAIPKHSIEKIELLKRVIFRRILQELT